MTTSTTIAVCAIFSIAFAGSILWLAWEAFSAPRPDRWAEFQDRINTQPESYQEAVAMVNTEGAVILETRVTNPNQGVIYQSGTVISITEDELTDIYEGKP